MTAGPWITVEITSALGSTPRDQGTMMWVSAARVDGTIGGGALEFRAIDRARTMLADGETSAEMELPLGPALNQCCGGFVRLTLTQGRLAAPKVTLFPLVLYGGGHVGTALYRALEPLPFAVRWLDERSNTPADQASLVDHATHGANGALHYVMTHDHQLDLAIVSALLRRSLEAVPFIGMNAHRRRRHKGQGALCHRRSRRSGSSHPALKVINGAPSGVLTRAAEGY